MKSYGRAGVAIAVVAALEALVWLLSLGYSAWVWAPLLAVPLVALAFEHSDQPRVERPPELWRRRIARLLLGAAAYPAASAASWYWLPGQDLDSHLAAYAAVSLIFGALVGRWWIALVPPAGWGTDLMVGYLSDPSCSRCGEDDTWASLLVLNLMFLIIPGTLCAAVGVLARQTATTWRRQRNR